ncbi:MAG: hypothetical protein KAS66_03180 [Candidatus Omnitrophica bacterium]|nr:hypothetical protein [Candidatus Omnitrophota bacterium]
MIFKKGKKGQSALEYSALLILLIAAFLAMQNYVKRGVQGRWKGSIDELGDQYDPRTADTNLRHTIYSNTNTQILVMNTLGGFWTRRTDEVVSNEQKIGYTSSGAY